MNVPLLGLCCSAVVVAVVPAQAITRTVAAATNLTVGVLDFGFPANNQTASIPLGTVLQDQQTVQVGSLPFLFSSIRVVMPATTSLTRYECQAIALGPTG